jgi:arylsulfatase A-like enzyme
MFFYNGADLFAYRKDRYKIHVFTSTYGNKGTVKQDPPLLYDLEQDPSEKMNIAAQHAEIVADLLRDMAAHQASFTPPPTQLEATIKE